MAYSQDIDLSFWISSVSTTSAVLSVYNSSSDTAHLAYYNVSTTVNGQYVSVIPTTRCYVPPGQTVNITLSPLQNGYTYRVYCAQNAEMVQILYFTTGSGGGTSGGGSSSGSWAGGSQTKTNTVSWNTSTAAGTSAYNYADACWSYGTVSLISSDSSWYGYSWVWARLDSVVETDVDVTYNITQGARTKNIADWPYHGMSIKYKDEENTEQTYFNLPATSTGNYWANAYLESSSYNYQVKIPFVNTISLTYRKQPSGSYTREVVIRMYNDHSYWCNLGGMYQWENILKITLTIPQRTKYIAAVRNSNGGTATVNNTTPEVYVNPNTTVNYVAVPDTTGGCTFNGWYTIDCVTYDDTFGYVVIANSTPVTTNTTYSKVITEDYELVAIFDGFHLPADWGEDAESQVYVKESAEWKLSDVYVKNSTWGKAVSFVG